MNDDTTAWDHIATAEDRLDHAHPNVVIAFSLLSIARSLASIDERQRVQQESAL